MESKPILVKDFRRFLHAVAENSPCQRCGNNTFAVVGEGSGHDAPCSIFASFGTGGKAEEVDMSRFWPSLLSCCANCGHMNHHAMKIVEEWLRNNPELSDA